MSEPKQDNQDYSHFKIVQARHTTTRIVSLLSFIIVAMIVHSTVTNERWGWPVFLEWFFAEPVLIGLMRTVLLTILGTIFGFALGTLLALARLSRSGFLASISWIYIWIFRSIPLIVLLLILNNLGYLYETIWIGIPYTDISLASWQTTHVITPFLAAVVGLTLNQASFAAEVVRGGILSVDGGQLEAAAALGLPKSRQIRRIILPQAMRSIIPAGFNEIIGLAKGTSQVYILALPELFYTVQVIYRRNLEVIPLLMVATVWYLVILTVLSSIQYFIERRYAKGALRNQPKSLIDRFMEAKQPSLSLPHVKFSSGGKRSEPFVQRSAGGSDLHSQGAILISNVSKSYGKLDVLKDVSLNIAGGSVTAIIGPSGSGKSTLLRSINHLERVDSGFISIDGQLIGYEQKGTTLYELKERDILKKRVDVGMVFQSFNLFPHLSVMENIIEAPLVVRGMTRKQAEDLAFNLLERVGLSDKAFAYPRQLSGGQQQRVAIARALALRPKVLLFDEPTSALDPELVNEVLETVKELAKSGTTLVIVTHEIGFAREIADTIVFMESGRIVESGTPSQILNNPASARTRSFISSIL
ncbi:amino acid ABC transporter permease/ATP-binding protein [Brucellaceae bacterium C25G]